MQITIILCILHEILILKPFKNIDYYSNLFLSRFYIFIPVNHSCNTKCVLFINDKINKIRGLRKARYLKCYLCLH